MNNVFSGGRYCEEAGLTEPTGKCDPGYFCTTGVNSKTPSFSSTGLSYTPGVTTRNENRYKVYTNYTSKTKYIAGYVVLTYNVSVVRTQMLSSSCMGYHAEML